MSSTPRTLADCYFFSSEKCRQYRKLALLAGNLTQWNFSGFRDFTEAGSYSAAEFLHISKGVLSNARIPVW